jgi:replicative DNA helicase
VIAARPSMGKTSLVMNMVEHVSVDQKVPTLVFSLEMSQKILVQRLIVSRAKLSMGKLRNGLLTNDEKTRLMRAVVDFRDSVIVIDETPGITIMELRRRARRIKKKHPDLGMIAIDYLQLMRSTSKKAQDNRQIEIAEISAGVKALAKELEVPIVVLAQLNRQVEQRKGGRPMLSDLRESGSIEQDADLVGLLTRSDYAGSKQDDEKQAAAEDEPGKALLFIAKHRNGPTGDVGLTFLKEFMRFESRELSPDEGE